MIFFKIALILVTFIFFCLGVKEMKKNNYGDNDKDAFLPVIYFVFSFIFIMFFFAI